MSQDYKGKSLQHEKLLGRERGNENEALAAATHGMLERWSVAEGGKMLE